MSTPDTTNLPVADLPDTEKANIPGVDVPGLDAGHRR